MITTLPFPAQRAARGFQALSDETRLELVRKLASREHCVCELTDALDASQSRLSFHLKTLRVAGIVDARREGRWMYYSLNSEVLGMMAEFLNSAVARAAELEGQTGCCG